MQAQWQFFKGAIKTFHYYYDYDYDNYNYSYNDYSNNYYYYHYYYYNDLCMYLLLINLFILRFVPDWSVHNMFPTGIWFIFARWIRNISGNYLLVESGFLGFEISNLVQGIQNPSQGWSQFHWQFRIQNPRTLGLLCKVKGRSRIPLLHVFFKLCV